MDDDFKEDWLQNYLDNLDEEDAFEYQRELRLLISVPGREGLDTRSRRFRASMAWVRVKLRSCEGGARLVELRNDVEMRLGDDAPSRSDFKRFLAELVSAGLAEHVVDPAPGHRRSYYCCAGDPYAPSLKCPDAIAQGESPSRGPSAGPSKSRDDE